MPFNGFRFPAASQVRGSAPAVRAKCFKETSVNHAICTMSQEREGSVRLESHGLTSALKKVRRPLAIGVYYSRRHQPLRAASEVPRRVRLIPNAKKRSDGAT